MALHRTFRTLAAFVALFSLWEILGQLQIYPAHLFPPPSHVLPALAEMANSGELWRDAKASARRWGAGFTIGTLLGILAGLATSRIAWIYDTIGQILHGFRSTPFIVLMPIAMLWFGIGEAEKISLVAWGVLFPVWLNVHAGIAGLQAEYFWAARVLGLRGWRLHWEVSLPSALPHVFTGMRVGIATGTFALAAAEMVGAFEGITYRVFHSYQSFQTQKMMAGIVVVGMLGLLLDRTFVAISRRLMPWSEQADGSAHVI